MARILPRHTTILYNLLLVGTILVTGFNQLPKNAMKTEKISAKDFSYEVLIQDAALCAYGHIATHDSSAFEKTQIILDADDRVAGYSLTNAQSFTKYVKYTGAHKNDLIGSQVASKVAYSFLLTGDVIAVTNKKTNQVVRKIDNARITYLRIPYIVSEDGNSVTFMNQVKERRTVSYSVFKDALSNLSIRTSILIRRSSEGIDKKSSVTSRLSEE